MSPDFAGLFGLALISLNFYWCRTAAGRKKKFEEYLDSDSEWEPEKAAPAAAESDIENVESGSTTEPLDGDSDESLILPVTKTTPASNEKKFALSESEPEDPEEVRKLQEKLKLRKSRLPVRRSPSSTGNRSRYQGDRTTNTLGGI